MECRILWIILSLLINASISFASQVVTRLLGQNATIQCPIQTSDSDLDNLYWRKDGTTIYSIIGNSEEINHRDYSVVNGTSLVIPDLVKADAGNYSCKIVRNSRVIDSETITMITLYVIDFSVSHCNAIQRDGDGCSCYINGANITSLNCSASGFPHSPVITWDEREITYESPSVNLTIFNKNLTLACKARDRLLEGISAKTRAVCVYYNINDGEGGPEKRIEPPKGVKIALPILIVLFILILLVALLVALLVYRRRKGKKWFVLPSRSRRTSMPQSTGALDDLRFNTLQHQMKSVEEDLASRDLPYDKFNENVVFYEVPEVSFPLVGQVLLDDLRSLSEDMKKSLKAVVIRLLNQRVKPYKEFQLPMDASTPLNASLLQSSMKESMVKDSSTDRDVAFVELVLQKLDQILDETDRDECEILITKPDFQEVTDASQIPTYQGNRIINRSMPLQTSMRSSTKSSRIACSLESSVIREELKTKTPSEKICARNDISQIILDALRKGRRANCNLLNRSSGMLQHTEVQLHGAEDLGDENSRLVALWASKLAKLDDEVGSSIQEYLFPLKPNKSKQSENTQHMEDTKKEPIGEPGEEPTTELKEEPVNEDDASDEDRNEFTDTHQTTVLNDSFQK